jgi:hypothetical protein
MNLPQIDDEQTSEQFFTIIMQLQNLWTHMIFFKKHVITKVMNLSMWMIIQKHFAIPKSMKMWMIFF